MSSKRKTWQGSDVSLNDLLELKVDDVKTKLSCETSLKNLSGRCENEAFVSCGGCDSGGCDSGGGDSGGCDVIVAVVLVMATIPRRKLMSENFA